MEAVPSHQMRCDSRLSTVPLSSTSIHPSETVMRGDALMAFRIRQFSASTLEEFPLLTAEAPLQLTCRAAGRAHSFPGQL
jgi:hypothetical protein